MTAAHVHSGDGSTGQGEHTVAAHEQAQSHHYLMHFPPHPARTSDPHYVDFNHYHQAHRKTARCYIGERIGFGDCMDAQMHPCPPPADGGQQPGLELHHSIVEFSLQNGVSLTALEHDYPGISDEAQVGAWIESDQNFRWLCVTEGSPVLMADGSWRAIEYVVPGDHVIGKDGQPHLVTASSRKRHRGEVVTVGAASFTPEHRLLGRGQWLPAAEVYRQVGMFGPQMVPLRGVQEQVRAGIVGPVAIDVVDALPGQEFAADPLFHHQDVLHDIAGAVPNADVTLRGDLRGAVADVPLRQFVERRQPALIGAVPPSVRPGAPMSRPVEGGGAGFAAPQMAWVAVVPRRTASFTGWVHDLSVAHSHSFIAGGLVAHNCAWHHRGAAGAHTASHSDWSASQYVQGLIAKA